MTEKSRLELTWANKDLRLLAHDDVSYEWVDPADWRVSEVRLLEHIAEVGEPGSENLLIQGDALHTLTALSSIPELSSKYLGRVKLCYIDPPFNTGQAFEHYDDALEHSVWLTMLRDRLHQIRSLLCSDGSVWVHLDDAEVHRARSVLDEVFGPNNFVATIIWQKLATRDNRTDISTTHDYIHLYARNRTRFAEVRNLLPYGEEQLARYANPDNDPRGDWQSDNMNAKAGPGRRAAQFYSITVPSGRVINPPRGRCWVYTEDRYLEMVADNRIWFGPNGDNVPRIKRFLSEVRGGLVPDALWLSSEVGTNDEAKKELLSLFPQSVPFATPKPERLLERIIAIGTNPGDLVLDCFGGSGTTAAVAHKTGRRWVTSELSQSNIETFARPRLEKVVAGEDSGGITKDVGWNGGGGFAHLIVGPSMFEQVDGAILLADWAVGGALAKAVCAQVRYTFRPDVPFVGDKGRSRLAVVDGMLTTGVVEFLIQYLDERQTLLVYAQALEPGIQEYVRSARSGSRARKIPRDLARIGARQGQLFRIERALS